MGKQHVLVAEADRTTAAVLTWLLGEHGYEATIAYPPMLVEAALRASRPDVLLFDGDDATLTALVQKLRRTEPFSGIRVIVAKRRPERDVGRVPDGADDCVEKPYRAYEVLNRVAAQLRMQNRLTGSVTLATFPTVESTTNS